MKKQLLLFIFLLSLIMLGSGALKSVNAQTGIGTKTFPKIQKKSAEIQARVRQIVREQLSISKLNGELGDPCDMNVPITVGQTLSGTLAVTDCMLPDQSFIDFYSFQGTAGQAISISLDSTQFDTFLFLLDANGDVIEQNDDGSTGTNSRIPDFGGVVILPTTGTYLIGANSFNPEETGIYTVSLNNSAACQTTPLAFNQTVNADLTGMDCIVNTGGEFFFKDLYTFEGKTGQQISIAMDSSAVNSFLILHTPSGADRLENNDGGGGVNARIPAGSGIITLTQTGTYTIEAGTFESGETGAYTLLLSGSATPQQLPAQFDFEGDGKTDISIFRPSAGEWWYDISSTGGNATIRFGNSSDKPVPADFTGDGKTDFAVWRPDTGEWFILRSEDNSFFSFPFGLTGDIPAPADYDGDGQANAAVYRPSAATWFILNSSGTDTSIVQFGISEDKPVVADYDGDGMADIAVFRPTTGAWWILRSGTGTTFSTSFGVSDDKPVQSDYTGDSKADIAVFRPSTGEWFILRSEDNSFFSFPFGLTGDIPTPGDYDGDGITDAAVFRPSNSTWFINRTSAGLLITNFGTSGDQPVPNAFVP